MKMSEHIPIDLLNIIGRYLHTKCWLKFVNYVCVSPFPRVVNLGYSTITIPAQPKCEVELMCQHFPNYRPIITTTYTYNKTKNKLYALNYTSVLYKCGNGVIKAKEDNGIVKKLNIVVPENFEPDPNWRW